MIQTLLQLTKTIMYSMDGEEIASINDNYESRQVANIIGEVYLNLIPQLDLPTHNTLFQASAPIGGSSAAYPTILQMPSNCIYFDNLKYDCHLSGTTDPLFTDLQYVPPHEFMSMMTSWAPSADTFITQFTYTINGYNILFEVQNNVPPRYWTSWDDKTISLDAFDSSVDTFSNPVKTQCWGKLDQTFTLADSFIPNLRSEQFPLLLQEAKALAWAQMKQVTNAKAEREAKRQLNNVGRKKFTGPDNKNVYQGYPNYGRSSPGFRVLTNGDSAGDGNFNSGFSSGFLK